MVLDNYVKLVTDVETVLRIREGSFRYEPRTVTDPKSKLAKTVRAAVLDVTEENGRPVTKTFSTLSDKLATTLNTMALNGDLYRYRVGITRVGEGFTTEYRIRVI